MAVSGLASSNDLKARVADFMERADELITHPHAGYKAPLSLTVTTNADTNEVSYNLDHRLLDKEPLVYFATMTRPMLWTEKEPIYVPKLIEAIRQEHPALQPMCTEMTRRWKEEWRNRTFLGLKSTAPPAYTPIDGWKLTNVWSAPVGAPMPADDLSEVPVIEDYEFAKLYLNGFVWHNDIEKTAGYRQTDELMKTHYRKCAEIRTFAGFQLIIKPIRQFFLDARAAGEDF